jgi:uncharacterized membrane protein
VERGRGMGIADRDIRFILPSPSERGQWPEAIMNNPQSLIESMLVRAGTLTCIMLVIDLIDPVPREEMYEHLAMAFVAGLVIGLIVWLVKRRMARKRGTPDKLKTDDRW